jgi:hypothetical protein
MTTYSIINIVIIVSILAILLMTLSAILYNRSQVALDFIGQPVGLCNECSHLAQAMLLKARSFAIAGAVMGAASAAVWFGRERLSTGKILEATEWLRLRFPDYTWTGFTLHIPLLHALVSFLRLVHLQLPKLRLPSRLSS